MPANNSSTGGYVVPTSSTPAITEDPALSDLLTALVSGVTGISNTLVRPRWQPQPPKQPDPATDWCAVGITARRPIDYPTIQHDSTGDGTDLLTRMEALDVLTSWYGPNAGMLSGLMRDGLYIPQNREALWAVGIKLTDVGDGLAVPDLVNAQWINRYDASIRLVRAIWRVYPILNLLSAQGTITRDNPTEIQSWTVTGP